MNNKGGEGRRTEEEEEEEKKEKEEVLSCLCYFNASKDLVLFERGMWI